MGFSAWGTELPPGFRIDGYDWDSAPFTAGEVEVVNPFGNLRARASDDGRIHLQAAIQKFGPEHDGFDLRRTEEEARVRVEVFLPPEIERGKARVDLTVMVPPGVRLSAATDFGNLVVNRFASPLRARSTSGKIKVDTALPVELESTGGAISARLTGAVWQQPSSLATRSGTIEVKLAEDAQVEVQTAGPGGAQLDCTRFRGGCRIEQRGEALTARIGEGGGPLKIIGGTEQVRIESVAVVRPAQTPGAPGNDTR